MKLYQAGPMRGRANYHYQTFEDGWAYLQWLGHEVVSPHRLDMKNGFTSQIAHWEENDHGIWQYYYEHVDLTDKFTPEAAMRIDVAAILDCDAVTFLPGWETSIGARNEYAVAKMLGLPVYEHEPWKYFREAIGRDVHVSIHRQSWSDWSVPKLASPAVACTAFGDENVQEVA